MGFFNRIKEIVRSQDVEKREKEFNKSKKTLFNLKIGDVIAVEEVDYEIEGIIDFIADGWKWTEYKLKDGLKTLWLSVEMDDEVEISMYETIKTNKKDTPKTYVHDGVSYYLDEGGVAIVERCVGLAIPIGKRVKYFEYCDEEEEKFLGVEIWDGDTEVSLGREIKEYNVEIYG